MKGVVFLGEKQMEIREFRDPTPADDEVIIQIKASGMCGSDLMHYRGPLRCESEQIIEGHEPCGVVVEVGRSVRRLEARVGQRVMVHHYDGCRVCHYCRSGWTQMCPTDLRVIYGTMGAHGAHAHFMKVPAHTIIPMPDGMSFKTGAAIACGTGTAYGAIKRVDLAGDETVAIFGQGPVGLSATLFAKAAGARVIALDVNEARLEMARQFGADILINPSKVDAVAAIRDVTRRGEGADKSLECSANVTARLQSIQSLRRWGTACMVGAYGKVEFEAIELIQRQKTVVGSTTFSKNQQDDCAQYIMERGLDVDSIFTHSFALEQAKEAYEIFDTQATGKGVFLFD